RVDLVVTRILESQRRLRQLDHPTRQVTPEDRDPTAWGYQGLRRVTGRIYDGGYLRHALHLSIYVDHYNRRTLPVSDRLDPHIDASLICRKVSRRPASGINAIRRLPICQLLR